MKPGSMFRSSATTIPDGRRLSSGLGWFSVALGAAELAVPRLLGKVGGLPPGGRTNAVVRAMGVRELAAGLAILSNPRRALPLWTRVAGDLVDLGLLGLALRSERSSWPRLAGAIAAVAGVTAVDVIAARRVQRSHQASEGPVLSSETINKPPAEVYKVFRRLAQLPTFMTYLVSVEELGTVQSRWTAKLPVGGTVSWTAEITEDRPGAVIAWRSIEESPIRTSGRVTFTRAPGREATEVRVEMQLGVIGKEPSAALARFFAKPQVKGDLRRFKQLVETGEVLVSDASAHSGKHPAQPSETIEHRPQVFMPNEPTAQKGVTP